MHRRAEHAGKQHVRSVLNTAPTMWAHALVPGWFLPASPSPPHPSVSQSAPPLAPAAGAAHISCPRRPPAHSCQLLERRLASCTAHIVCPPGGALPRGSLRQLLEVAVQAGSLHRCLVEGAGLLQLKRRPHCLQCLGQLPRPAAPPALHPRRLVPGQRQAGLQCPPSQAARGLL